VKATGGGPAWQNASTSSGGHLDTEIIWPVPTGNDAGQGYNGHGVF
jgi:hypothetical protein